MKENKPQSARHSLFIGFHGRVLLQVFVCQPRLNGRIGGTGGEAGRQENPALPTAAWPLIEMRKLAPPQDT